MPNAARSVQKWLERVADDELACRAVLKESVPSVACFLSQQIAEKMLKVLLVHHGVNAPKIHDLKKLATLLEPLVPDIFSLEEEYNILNKYYATTRYPGDVPEGFSRRAAEEAFESALRVKDFVMPRLGNASLRSETT